MLSSVVIVNQWPVSGKVLRRERESLKAVPRQVSVSFSVVALLVIALSRRFAANRPSLNVRHRLLIIPLLSLFVACAQTRDSAPVIVSGRAIMEDGVGIEYRIVGEGPQVVLARASLPDVCQFENEWPVNLWPYFDRLLGSQGEYDWRDGLRTLEVPRLVLHGTQDRIAMEHAEEWAKYPNARLIVVEGAAHLPFLEKPQQVLSAIEVFLSGDWPTGARTLSQ